MPAAKVEHQTTIKAGPGQGRPWVTVHGSPGQQREFIIEYFGLDADEAVGKSVAELSIVATLTYSGMFDRHLRDEGTGAEVQDLPKDEAPTEEAAPRRSGRGRQDKISKALRAIGKDEDATIEDLRQVYRDNADKWDRDYHGQLAAEVKEAKGWE